jgi:hypothetical protein
VNTSHPRDERFGILERPTAITGIHPGKQFIPLIDEGKREVELTSPNQTLIIYTPVTPIGVQASPTFISWHEGAKGTSGIF